MKKFMLIIMCSCLLICGLTTNISASDYIVSEEYLETWKEEIGEKGFFQYTPISQEHFLKLDEESVVGEFEGVIVKKKMLDDNYLLDIDKITVYDFNEYGALPIFETDMPITRAVVPNISGSSMDGTYTLPSNVKSVVVSSRFDYSDGSILVQTISYFSKEDWNVFLSEMAIGYLLSDVYESAIMGIFGLASKAFIPTWLTGCIYFSSAFNAAINAVFYNEAKKYIDKSVKFTVRDNYKTVSSWTDRKYTLYNHSLNGSVFKSNYKYAYK